MGTLVSTALTDPGQVSLIALILQATGNTSQSIVTHLNGEQFELTWGEPISTLLFLIASIWIMSLLAGIVRVLSETGTGLMRMAKNWQQDEA